MSARSSSNEGIVVIKLEPDDLHDSMVDVSEQIENNSDTSELLQNVDKCCENESDSYYYKK